MFISCSSKNLAVKTRPNMDGRDTLTLSAYLSPHLYTSILVGAGAAIVMDD